MLSNSEKYLLDLKLQLTKAEAALKSPEFRKKKDGWGNELADILAFGGSTYYQSRYDQVFQEEETIYDLKREIFELSEEMSNEELSKIAA